MNSLVDIFDKHNCDKGQRRHRYDRIYEPAFAPVQQKKFNMLEVGILRGESLKAHLEYFPAVELYAIDIFGRIPSANVPILTADRVHWCKCDSIQGPNEAFNAMVGDVKFDIIIDDGLHTHDSQRCTFENFIPYLNEGGTYFIEDVWPFDRMNKQQKQHSWIKRNPKDYSDAQHKALLTTIEPYTVKFHDIREGFYPDTFIIEITK